MSYNPPPKPSKQLDALDFQVTDFDEARRALDELPAGVAELARIRPDYWVSRRRPPRAADKALTGAALDWLMRLPPSARPQELCTSYPRVANMLAEVWHDPPSAMAELDKLIDDRRGGRRGFSAAVRAELQSLRDLRSQSVPQPPRPA
jgi:hypothetical protein